MFITCDLKLNRRAVVVTPRVNEKSKARMIQQREGSSPTRPHAINKNDAFFYDPSRTFTYKDIGKFNNICIHCKDI